MGRLQLLRGWSPVLRLRYAILATVAVFVAVAAYMPPGKDDWLFFVSGSKLLLGEHVPWAEEPGGLHLYANYGATQIGPLTLTLVGFLRKVLDDDGTRLALIVLMTMAGPMLVGLLERSAIALGSDDEHEVSLRKWTVLLGGAVFVVAWANLTARYVHVDDGLTLIFACTAMWAVARGRPSTTGAMIGLATAAKPWGIVALPMILVFHGRPRRRAAAAAAIVLGVTWLPFVIADPSTITAGKPAAETMAGSVLHLFGVRVGSSPGWVRLAQLGAALLLGIVAVRRGQWTAVLLLGVVARVLLDPAVFAYYMAAVIVAAFAWELLRRVHPLPVLTMTLFWLLFVATITLHADRAKAILRLVACVTTVVVVLSAPSASEPLHEVDRSPR
jgi:hypothetical protein